MKLNRTILISLLTLSICSCNLSRKKIPDVSNIDLDIKFIRLDSMVFSANDSLKLDALCRRYPNLMQLYSNKVIMLGDINNPNFPYLYNKFVSDTTMNEVYQSVADSFPSLNQLQDELTLSFKYLKYYIPKITNLPQFFTQISGFNQNVVLSDKYLGLSLDKYLGSNHIFYSRLATPLYARKYMTKENIAADIMESYLVGENDFNPKSENLVSNFIYKGKIRYLMSMVFPSKLESDLLKFSDTQHKWCEDNEAQIWGYIIENKELFTTEGYIISRYLSPGPFTRGLPRESPARIGEWIGLKIVQAYFEQNPNIELIDFLKENDYEKILRDSGYNPS
ncbi:MAG: hypothetical protein N4A49_16140 [Marinifilaceae bacterium]|jgi:hypothetical protein|nr:hypothetical protein [Marinifilaceae bacterium]